MLGRSDVQLDTNLFELGVQSLQLVRAHRMLQERLKRPLRLMDMVEHPNIRRLAEAWALHDLDDPAPKANPLAQQAMARARRARQAQFGTRIASHGDSCEGKAAP